MAAYILCEVYHSLANQIFVSTHTPLREDLGSGELAKQWRMLDSGALSVWSVASTKKYSLCLIERHVSLELELRAHSSENDLHTFVSVAQWREAEVVAGDVTDAKTLVRINAEDARMIAGVWAEIATQQEKRSAQNILAGVLVTTF